MTKRLVSVRNVKRVGIRRRKALVIYTDASRAVEYCVSLYVVTGMWPSGLVLLMLA
jgi:hypothetical protein